MVDTGIVLLDIRQPMLLKQKRKQELDLFWQLFSALPFIALRDEWHLGDCRTRNKSKRNFKVTRYPRPAYLIFKFHRSPALPLLFQFPFNFPGRFFFWYSFSLIVLLFAASQANFNLDSSAFIIFFLRNRRQDLLICFAQKMVSCFFIQEQFSGAGRIVIRRLVFWLVRGDWSADQIWFAVMKINIRTG